MQKKEENGTLENVRVKGRIATGFSSNASLREVTTQILNEIGATQKESVEGREYSQRAGEGGIFQHFSKQNQGRQRRLAF